MGDLLLHACALGHDHRLEWTPLSTWVVVILVLRVRRPMRAVEQRTELHPLAAVLFMEVAAGLLLEEARDHRCRFAMIELAIDDEPLRHPVA
jgi:hypothetical protein